MKITLNFIFMYVFLLLSSLSVGFEKYAVAIWWGGCFFLYLGVYFKEIKK